MKRLATLLVMVLGVALAWTTAALGEESAGTAQAETAGAPAPASYETRVERQRARSAARQAAHEARIQAMREESERFRERAGSYAVPMDPWARGMLARQELRRRMMDPYGSAMLDRLEEDFWNRTAAYGGRPEVADPHREASQWARAQQQAIYENTRRAQENLAQAVREGKVTYAPVVPWVPYGGWYAPYGWGAPYLGYGAPYLW